MMTSPTANGGRLRAISICRRRGGRTDFSLRTGQVDLRVGQVMSACQDAARIFKTQAPFTADAKRPPRYRLREVVRKGATSVGKEEHPLRSGGRGLDTFGVLICSLPLYYKTQHSDTIRLGTQIK